LGVAPDYVDFEGLIAPIMRGRYINDMLREHDEDAEEMEDAYLPVTPREAAAFERVVEAMIKFGDSDNSI